MGYYTYYYLSINFYGQNHNIILLINAKIFFKYFFDGHRKDNSTSTCFVETLMRSLISIPIGPLS